MTSPMKDDDDSETISWLAIPMFKLGMVIREVCGKELGEKLVDNIDEWLEPELHAAFEAERSKAALDARIDELTYIRAFSGQPYAMSDINDRPLTIKDRIKELSDALKQGPTDAK